MEIPYKFFHDFFQILILILVGSLSIGNDTLSSLLKGVMTMTWRRDSLFLTFDIHLA
jgi:hypothetical protein